MSAPLRVNFILHAIGKTGGVLVVLEYARRLRKAGHDARVYYPLVPYPVYFDALPAWKRLPARVYAAFKALLGARAARRAGGDAGVRAVPFVADAFIRDADVTIATAWPTAYDVAALGPGKGAKAYFLQGHETWNGRAGDVHASYRLPLFLIAVSSWLADIVREKSGGREAVVVPNGVDESWRPPRVRASGPPSILMMHHSSPAKGSADGLRVLRKVRARHPGIKVVLFGQPPPDGLEGAEYHRDPSWPQLLRLYQEADIYLSPSHSDGWGLTVVEAMACGCAVAATRVGCVPDLEGSGGLLAAEPGDIGNLARAVDSLVSDPARRLGVARKGTEAVARYRWENSARRLEEILTGLAGRGGTGP